MKLGRSVWFFCNVNEGSLFQVSKSAFQGQLLKVVGAVG